MDIIELANNCDYDTLSALGFVGTDASLEISMDEYGLALKPSENYEGEFTILYSRQEAGIETSCNVWDCLTQSPKYFTDQINDSWFDKSAFFGFLDCLESRWLLMPLVNQIQDLISYYGYENLGM